MTTKDNEGFIRSAKDITAGSVGGIAQVLTGQPFDIVKVGPQLTYAILTTQVRLQTQLSSGPKEYTGAIDCVKKIIANEGFRGFYKGTATPLVGVGACVSIQFGTFEYMKRYFRTRNEQEGRAITNLSGGQFYLAGCAAGISNTVVACIPRTHEETDDRSCRVDSNTVTNSEGEIIYWSN
jgi:solute carrier family 25 (mitochondrial carnitine/acylcarnitine transporter), member 20/29